MSRSSQPKKVALVYDRVNSWGGAERVLLALHSLYPDAPLYTSVYDESSAAWAKSFTVRPSFLQRIPWLRSRHRWFGWLMPLAFETLDLSDYDLIISVSSEAAKGVLTRPEQLHVCYLLTPTRYLWSHREEYSQQIPVWLSPLLDRCLFILQRWDQVAAWRPDIMIPISRLVQNRVQKYYRRKTETPLYPGYPSLPEANPERLKQKLPAKFLFSWGRQVAYKRFDEIITAAVELAVPFYLAGTGPEAVRLKKLARKLDPKGKIIHLVGKISDEELASYLRSATVAVFPQQEDFGIAPLEAISQGCPVVVHRNSGVAELLKERENAVFIDTNEKEEIQRAIKTALEYPWQHLDIRTSARQYAEASFLQSWQEKMQSLWNEHQQHWKGNL